MHRPATLGLAGLMLALPFPAAAQPAAWAQDGREAVCVYDGLLAGVNAPPGPSQAGIVRDECRQRFGWSADQGNRGLMVAMIMFQMMAADSDARTAGVDPAAIDAVRRTFTSADATSLGQPGEPVTDRGRATIDLIARRVREQGLTGEPARKATSAVLFQMMAETIIAAFAAEVMPAPGR